MGPSVFMVHPWHQCKALYTMRKVFIYSLFIKIASNLLFPALRHNGHITLSTVLQNCVDLLPLYVSKWLLQCH